MLDSSGWQNHRNNVRNFVSKVKSFGKSAALQPWVGLDDEKLHPNYDIGVWINTEFFALALEQMFELAWKEMKPIELKN